MNAMLEAMVDAALGAGRILREARAEGPAWVKEKGQNDERNRVILDILDRIGSLEGLRWDNSMEQVARQALRPQTGAPAYQLPPEAQPPDLTGSSGPVDPWGAGRAGGFSR